MRGPWIITLCSEAVHSQYAWCATLGTPRHDCRPRTQPPDRDLTSRDTNVGPCQTAPPQANGRARPPVDRQELWGGGWQDMLRRVAGRVARDADLNYDWSGRGVCGKGQSSLAPPGFVHIDCPPGRARQQAHGLSWVAHSGSWCMPVEPCGFACWGQRHTGSCRYAVLGNSL